MRADGGGDVHQTRIVADGDTSGRKQIDHVDECGPAAKIRGARQTARDRLPERRFATDQDVIMAFGLEKPVFRIAVNTMGTLGAIGLTTGVMPSLTLGAGGVGGSITGDNITARHLFNVKRLAYELSAPPAAALVPGQPEPGPSVQEIERAVRNAVEKILHSS